MESSYAVNEHIIEILNLETLKIDMIEIWEST